MTSPVVKAKPASVVFPLIFDHILLRELLTLYSHAQQKH